MRPVLVHQQAIVVVVVVGVPTDVGPLVHEQHFFAADLCQALGNHAAGKPGTDNQVIKHLFSCFEKSTRRTSCFGDFLINPESIDGLTTTVWERRADQLVHLCPRAVPGVACEKAIYLCPPGSVALWVTLFRL